MLLTFVNNVLGEYLNVYLWYSYRGNYLANIKIGRKRRPDIISMVLCAASPGSWNVTRPRELQVRPLQITGGKGPTKGRWMIAQWSPSDVGKVPACQSSLGDYGLARG